MKTNLEIHKSFIVALAFILSIGIFTGCGNSEEQKTDKEQKIDKNEVYQQNVEAASEALGSHQYSKAIDLLKEGAENGHSRSQGLLGVSYMMSEQEYEGAKWIRKAAENGDPVSVYNMAVCYYHGIGVQKNEGEAQFWVEQAEELGVKEPGKSGSFGVKDGRAYSLRWWVPRTFKY